MKHLNTAQPVDTVVPSALAERRRIWQSDGLGITVYIIAVAAFVLGVLVIVLLHR